jgi:hypothetical protein
LEHIGKVMKIDFVKGHCGWDTVTLIPAGHIAPEQELEAALKILDAPVNGGLEVGFMGTGERADEIRLRMVESTTRTWTAMCGGMTQVIGKALVETFFRNHFNVDVSGPTLIVKLVTDSGVIPIEIDVEDGHVRRTTTVMDDYAAFVYRRGVAPLDLNGVHTLAVDDLIIMDVRALEYRYPGVEFARRDAGPHLEIVNAILRAFQQHRDAPYGVLGMMYDDRPEGPGQFRLFPRFFSADFSAASIPFEFQCGTGTVAVAVALAYNKRLPFDGPEGRIVFEWGSQRMTPDPYGIRTSLLDVGLSDGRVSTARFSHSVVEILAEGTLVLPGYCGAPALTASRVNAATSYPQI